MKIFVLVSRVPYPLDKGDKLRAYHQVKYLAQKHEVFLCCLDDANTSQKNIDHLREFCQHVEVLKLNKFLIYLNMFRALFSGLPFQVWYFYQAKAYFKIRNYLKQFEPDHIYAQLIRTTEYVKNEHGVRKTLDYQDAFSKGIERRIDKAGWLKPLFQSEARRLVKYENLMFDYFENKTIITEQDRALIYHQNRNQISIIPNGIDTTYFQPVSSEKKYELVFVGNMSYAPNIESAIYLANEVLVQLHQTHPNAKLLIAGASPSKEVKALASSTVTVSGWMEDIRSAYASGKIFIAPMTIGTGLQNKLLEAMAMGIPCVTSTLANNALEATHNKDLLICTSTDSYVSQINRLLSDPSFYQEIADNGQNFVHSKFSWQHANAKLTELIEKK